VLHAPQYQQSPSSTVPTVIPYIPSAPLPISRPEPNGTDRSQPQQQTTTYHVIEPPVNPRSLGRFSGEQSTMAAAPGGDWIVGDFKDELVRDVGTSVTPDVDNTPYILYALDALTQPTAEDRGVSGSSQGTNPLFRYLPNTVPGLFQPTPAHLAAQTPQNQAQSRARGDVTSPEEELAAMRRRRANSDGARQTTPLLVRHPSLARPVSGGTVRVPYTPDLPDWHREPMDPRLLDDVATPTPQPARPTPRTVNNWRVQTDRFVDPEKAAKYPPLTYRPWILGTRSLSIFATLCVLMIAVLMFCAIYSNSRKGLMAYSGTIYDGNYFLFRVFPQLLAALLLLYAQNIIIAAFRVLPFSALASDDVRSRRNVGFLPLYPKSFLWPQLVSTWQVWIPIVITWVMNITIPLQSCLFTVVYVAEVWTWSTVQGVAWVLVALYVSMLLSTLLLIIYWRNRRTGLGPNWDMRSLADIIALLSPSNSSLQYTGTESAATRNDMRHMLYNNIDRLGYWRSLEAKDLGIWYGIGTPANGEKVDIDSLGAPIHEKGPRDPPRGFVPDQGNIRARYLPWCVRDTQVTLWAVASVILFVALFVVCFNPATDIRRGFLPLLSAAPVQGAFSAADFLYAFVPSFLGMIVFLLFQSLDLTLRVLTPWGEMSRKEGSLARTSILVDYAACLPLESTWKALRNRHWRVAVVSLLATLFVLIPVLAGGLFLALTPSSGIVHMFPNVPILAILLTLLLLMVFALVSLIPNRDQFCLPHAVTCLAEIISFCYNEDLRTDPAFKLSQGHRHLKERLGVYLDDDEQSRWYFGGSIFNHREPLGIRRFGRYSGDTPQVLAAKQRAKAIRDRAGQALARGYAWDRETRQLRDREIGRPVPKGSTTMISF
jgi:hypothetical protein